MKIHFALNLEDKGTPDDVETIKGENILSEDFNMGAFSIILLEDMETKDILKELGKNKKNRFICGFSMETKNMTENSRKKLENKNLDMIVCNNLKVEGAGFQGDTNVVTVIDKTNITELGIMSKTEVADKILDRIAEINK